MLRLTPSTTIVASAWPPARRDRPTLEHEVVSRSESLSQWEGWEDAATEWTSTMVMELKTKNDGQNQPLPFLARQMSNLFYDTSIGPATGAARCGFLFGTGFDLLVVSSRWTQ
jgi:hypothetical protein